ncbi:hypothetical protein AK812_SmicGene18309 [Symbiodinium microadriaticum]|uniref:Uncharacterized protein n=1 Tax=Symbiodinium microadriaticum TaxID=2951 RepID=A0A1Q9DVE6_SYMMI|nr:hypothetical protein AK812_SmicGene18309 [Symbiodinium microadriaticum]
MRESTCHEADEGAAEFFSSCRSQGAEDVPTFSKIEAIVDNYRSGGYVKELARVFWRAEKRDPLLKSQRLLKLPFPGSHGLDILSMQQASEDETCPIRPADTVQLSRLLVAGVVTMKTLKLNLDVMWPLVRLYVPNARVHKTSPLDPIKDEVEEEGDEEGVIEDEGPEDEGAEEQDTQEALVAYESDDTAQMSRKEQQDKRNDLAGKGQKAARNDGVAMKRPAARTRPAEKENTTAADKLGKPAAETKERKPEPAAADLEAADSKAKKPKTKAAESKSKKPDTKPAAESKSKKPDTEATGATESKSKKPDTKAAATESKSKKPDTKAAESKPTETREQAAQKDAPKASAKARGRPKSSGKAGEASSGVPAAKSKAKKRGDDNGHDFGTPPAKKAKNDNDTSGEKQTFAGRRKPNPEASCHFWRAVKQAFETEVQDRVKAPSKLEAMGLDASYTERDTFFKFCLGSIESDDVDDMFCKANKKAHEFLRSDEVAGRPAAALMDVAFASQHRAAREMSKDLMNDDLYAELQREKERLLVSKLQAAQDKKTSAVVDGKGGRARPRSKEPVDMTPRRLFASPDVTMSDGDGEPKSPQTEADQEKPAELPQTKPTPKKQEQEKPPELPQTKPIQKEQEKPTKLPQTETIHKKQEQEKPAELPQTNPSRKDQGKLGKTPSELSSQVARDEGNGSEDDVVPEQKPPPQLSKGAVDKRLRRVMTPRVDGSYQVPEAVVLKWKNSDTKKDVELLFEKAAYDPASFIRKVRKIYQKIDEESFTTDYQFVSEASLPKPPMLERKSDYGEGWLYWVAIKIHGSTKRTLTQREEVGESDEECSDLDEKNMPGDDGDETSSEEEEQEDENREKLMKQLKFPDLDGDHSPGTLCWDIIKAIQRRTGKMAVVEKRFLDITEPLPLQEEMGTKVQTTVKSLTDLEEKLTQIYSQGEAVIDLDRAEQYAEMLGSGVEASAKPASASDAKRCWARMVGDGSATQEVLDDMLRHLAKELLELFETGLEVNSIMMCSVCEAGAPGIPWDRIELDPIWSSSLYASRPWAKDPPLLAVPFDSTRPEMFYRFDLFHLIKVGLGRDIAGGLVLLAKWGFWDGDGDTRNLPDRLDRAHMAFKMWASASGKTPALRSFKMGLFNMKNMTDFPWTNTKGSDTMLLLEFIRWTCDLHLSSPTPQSRPHEELLRLYRQTVGHTLKIFDICNHHGLWLSRSCGQNLFANLMCMLSGYISLAKMTCDMNELFFSVKPKLHATHHVAYELQQMLHTTAPLIPNPLMYACEGNESHVGHICDLAQVVDTRLIDKRVVERHFCKVAAVLRRHVESR